MMITRELIERARANVKKHSWAAGVQREAVTAAAPWMAMSDDELWGLMFGPAIPRSWMVWSNGHCPACRQSVPMYNWKVAALKEPWKIACPHCEARFPTNDFAKFHASGLDEHSVFDPARADRSLLFNTDHPDPKDPKHTFGVDDGHGYVEGENRWRFVATYLIYGQWKQVVLGGITRLSTAFAITGDPAYARKAGILLDRVADLYPGFDHRKQAWVYEKTGDDINCDGFVSTWHDCCEETRELALAYGLVRDAFDDKALVDFLRDKARRFSPVMPKTRGEDIQHNIEVRILREALAQPQKIRSNYPRSEICKAILHIELNTPDDNEKADVIINELVAKSVKVDGVTGEKGLAGYTCGVIQSLAQFLAQLENRMPGNLKSLIAKHPALARTYRFHADTWCVRKYYPQIGDTGTFAGQCTSYVGAPFSKMPSLNGSQFTLFWHLYEVTGDPVFVQLLYIANGETLEGLPHDLFIDDPARFQRAVAEVIRQHGAELRPGSVNFQQWHLAILRSGEGQHERALWIDYDTGGAHSHADGMNIGLFAKGIDLMPELGYPPVQFGGWLSDRATWYTLTAAHNTVLIDGKDQGRHYQLTTEGKTAVWSIGDPCKVVRVTDPVLTGLAEGPRQYDRTLAMVDISLEDFYILDVFRVVGGHDHAKFQHSHFAKLETAGLKFTACEAPFADKRFQMRGFHVDPLPGEGWTAQWRVIDEYKHLSQTPHGHDVWLRYTDLTKGAAAYKCEMWVATGNYNSTTEAWVPRIITRRLALAGEGPLASTFIAVIEPTGPASRIASIRRLVSRDAEGNARPDGDVAVEVTLADGRQDLIISLDAEDALKRGPGVESTVVISEGWDVELEGEFAFIRRDLDGKISTRLANATILRVAGKVFKGDR